MKKLNLTALSTAICSLSIAVSVAAPSFAQPQPGTMTTPATQPAPAGANPPTTPGTAAPATKTAPAGTSPQAQPIVEQLKLTKEQQAKLAKLERTVTQKQMSVLTPTQKEQAQQGKAANITLTVDQQNQLKAIVTAALAQRDAILTPEQKQKLQEMNKQFAPQPQR
jgi:Spy/CpxP family protein refolding chaperone